MDPGSAAMEFLEKIREGTLDLEPGGDTALQPTTSEKKRMQIRQDIGKLEEVLRGGELELGDVTMDGKFAGVLVLKPGGFDSMQSQVFPVALVRRGEDWLPAPVLASFENAVAAYTVPLKGRLLALESWMLQKRVKALGELMDESASRMRESIAKSVSEDFLKNGKPGEIVERFIEACERRDSAAILGFLGGLSDPLPRDWEARVKVSQVAATGAGKLESPWYLLSSPEVVRVRVLEDLNGKRPMISFGCLSPRQTGSRGTIGIISLIHLFFERDGQGRWRIDPSDALMKDDAEALSEDSEFDVDLLDRFPEVFREKNPLVGVETLAKAEGAVMNGLESGGLADLLRLVDFGERGKDGRIACAEAAELWWSVNGPGEFRIPVRLGSMEEGSLSVVAYQWFSVAQPDRYEQKTLYFKKRDGGWVWAPGVVPPIERKDQQVLSEWAKANQEAWRISWRASLIAESTRIAEADIENLPTDLEAIKVVTDWTRALKKKQMKRALELSAWIGKEGETPLKALRNLSYELSAMATGGISVGRVYRQGQWVAVRVTKKAEEDAKDTIAKDFFIIVQMTEKGAKVVPELDLLGEVTRTRSFLNKETFSRLEAWAGQAATKELRELFEVFLHDVKPD